MNHAPQESVGGAHLPLLGLNCLFVCLGFNGTFSTNRLYRAITVGYHIGAGDNTNT